MIFLLRVILSKMVPGLDASVGIMSVLIASLALPLIFERIARRAGAEGWLGLRSLFFNDRAHQPNRRRLGGKGSRARPACGRAFSSQMDPSDGSENAENQEN